MEALLDKPKVLFEVVHGLFDVLACRVELPVGFYVESWVEILVVALMLLAEAVVPSDVVAEAGEGICDIVCWPWVLNAEVHAESDERPDTSR